MVNRYSQRYNFSKINDIMLNVKVFIKLNLKIGILHQMPEKGINAILYAKKGETRFKP